MAHELEFVEGQASFIGQQSAWHELGEIVGDSFDRPTIEERAPWILSDVEKIVAQYPIIGAEGVQIVEGETAAVVRTYDGKIVGEGHGAESYGIVQVSDILGLAEEIASAGEFPIVSAGTLRNGTQTFFTLKTGDASPAGYNLETYVTACTSHDGSLSAQVFGSSIVTVCANTLAMSLGGAFQPIKVKHTRNAADRIETIRATLAAQAEAREALADTLEALANVKLTQDDLRNLATYVVPEPTAERAKALADTTRASILGLYSMDERCLPWHGTGLGFVQAVNVHENWHTSMRLNGKAQGEARALRQFDQMRAGQPLTDLATTGVLALAN